MLQVGFPRRKPEKLQLALQNTHVVLWVRATKQTRWARRGQLLGFARATSDHALFGTIWDVAVRQQQRKVATVHQASFCALTATCWRIASEMHVAEDCP